MYYKSLLSTKRNKVIILLYSLYLLTQISKESQEVNKASLNVHCIYLKLYTDHFFTTTIKWH